MSLFTVDFETYYDKEYSLSKMTTEAYVRDPRFEVIGVSVKVDAAPPTWFSGPHQDVASWLGQFAFEGGFFLAHNTVFDGFILTHHFKRKPRFYFDTLSMARPIHGMTVGGSLKALSDHYMVGVKGDDVLAAIGKHREDFMPWEIGQYGNYCINDVQLTYMLFQILKKRIPTPEIKVIDCMLRMYCEPLLELDQEKLIWHLGEVKIKKAAVLARVEELCGKDVLMSNQKFAQLLKDLGVEPPTKISPTTKLKTYAFAKADPQFKALLDHPDERIQTLVGARLGVKSTIEETRTEALIGVEKRGNLPILLHYYGAHTGRASGGDKINLQNLPRKGALRKAIRAPKNYKLMPADSAQIEARIVAWLAGQQDLVDAFARGEDIYSAFASEVYGRPVDRKYKTVKEDGTELYPDFTEGFVGKTCILGLGFEMGRYKFQATLKSGVGGPPVDMDLAECGRIVNFYRRKYYKIPSLWSDGDWALNAILRGEEFRFGPGGLLYTSEEGIHLPNGMLVRYPCLTSGNSLEGTFYAGSRQERAEWTRQKLVGVWEPDKLTRIYGGKVIENVVQALARIVVFDQMLLIAPHYRVVLTVHDEVVPVVPEDEVRTAYSFIKQAMETVPSWAPGLPIACEVKVGDSYGDVKVMEAQ